MRSRNDRNNTPADVRVYTVRITPDRDRPNRSNPTTTSSPARTWSSNAANPGRSSRTPENLSVKTRPHPAAVSASVYAPSDW